MPRNTEWLAARNLPASKAVDEAVAGVLIEYCLIDTKVRPFSTSTRCAYLALQWYVESLVGNTSLQVMRTFERDEAGDTRKYYRVTVSTAPASGNVWPASEFFEVYGEAGTQALAICRMILHIEDDDAALSAAGVPDSRSAANLENDRTGAG